MKTFKAELQVRGYELDGYGHVNNAVYLNYAEHARWQMTEEVGGGADYFRRNGVAPVLVRVEVDFKEPCYLAEWLVVETQLVEFRKRTARFSHKIVKRDSGKVAAEIIALMVTVNEAGKAVSLPEGFEAAFGTEG